MSEEIKHDETIEAQDNVNPQEVKPEAVAPEEDDKVLATAVQVQRIPKFKKKVCRFCEDPNVAIDYKNPDLLVRFI
ncbi:MAG TPA: hypothetical protein PK348_06215, partial [Spirochaetota bacterium]|nr:hypothetical protein [Spirochaetota bacterium]